MSRLTSARVGALVATAASAAFLVIGAGAPARTAAPTVWSASGLAVPASPPTPGHWPRRAARDYAMYTPAGNRAIRAIVLTAARQLRAGRERDAVLDDVRATWQQVATAHREAYDGIVRRALARELDRYLAARAEPPIDLALLSDLA